MAISNLLIKFLLLVAFVILAVGCNTNDPKLTDSPLSPLASPFSNSPQPSPPSKSKLRFSIDEPVMSGTKEISGKGPSGIPLQVVDITTGGEVLGSGRISADGYFRIKLGKPIKENHIIGIQLATPKDPNTWTDLWAMRGEGARAIPQIGDFFDTVVSSGE
jgi:hypothetical protein